ncbi:hypothetical protein EYI16_24785, partial [Escherichia coli]|nr:hypothetical protein [Escherichia coli]
MMRIKPIALLAFLFMHNLYAEELADNYSFDPAFIRMANKNNNNDIPDLKYFSRADGFMPGEYSVDIVLNNERLGEENIL